MTETLEKYTVVVKQKRSLFGWKRDHSYPPMFLSSHVSACAACEIKSRNLSSLAQGKIRYIIVSIDKV